MDWGAMSTFRCSNCKKPDGGYQFGGWIGYHPQPGSSWVTRGHCGEDDQQVTQEQMDLLSNPNNSSTCCDAPLEVISIEPYPLKDVA